MGPVERFCNVCDNYGENKCSRVEDTDQRRYAEQGSCGLGKVNGRFVIVRPDYVDFFSEEEAKIFRDKETGELTRAVS